MYLCARETHKSHCLQCACSRRTACFDLCLLASVHVREEQAALIEQHQRQLTRNEGEQSHLSIAHPQHKTAQRSGSSPPCVYFLRVDFGYWFLTLRDIHQPRHLPSIVRLRLPTKFWRATLALRCALPSKSSCVHSSPLPVLPSFAIASSSDCTQFLTHSTRPPSYSRFERSLCKHR